ncbi:ribbon-helix-helix CopG family protein [Litorimonas taeanensis]|uniref:Ribbon-helix-helix CopG family protein n=1 Tax=Litorimonas taeanensis TaxID=568099 RepID=A0A420WIZ3_9PROT|nr:ribbon-helix-helix protein, CopG family [Litorimonas taeanensis]RKQ70973.1 ribbon-helix-helix CopG family protein [Litorimonas taeanensis]
MPSTKPAKKSEMLEVRLSYKDKQDLQNKAKAEGLSVSEVVRHLISDYLAQPKSRALSQRIMEIIMRGHTKTKSAIATTGLIILGALTLSPLSNAEDISLNLQGTAIQPVMENGENGLRTRRFETEILLDSGKTVSLGFDGSHLQTENISDLTNENVPETPHSDDLIITVSAKNIDDKVQIDMKILMITPNSEGQATKLVANPKLTANFDEKSTIELELEGNQVFNLVVTPTKLSKSE